MRLLSALVALTTAAQASLNVVVDNTSGSSPGFQVSWDQQPTETTGYKIESSTAGNPFVEVHTADKSASSYFVSIPDSSELGCYTFKVTSQSLGVFETADESCVKLPDLSDVTPTTSVESDRIKVDWSPAFASTQFEASFTSFQVDLYDTTGTTNLASGSPNNVYAAVSDTQPVQAPNCYKAQVTASFGAFGSTTSLQSAQICHGSALTQPTATLDTDATSVTVSWDLSSAEISPGGTVTQFSVLPSTYPTNADAAIRTVSSDSATSFRWNMASAKDFGAFEFQVMYTYASGETSAWSTSSASVTFEKPPAVTNLVVTADDNPDTAPRSRFTVAFTESTLTPFVLSSYEVVFADESPLPDGLVYDTTSNSIAFTGLPAGCYTFRVRTNVDTFGAVALSDPSDEHCFAPTPQITAASAPSDAPARFQVDWQLPSDTTNIQKVRINPSATSQNTATSADVVGAVTTGTWNLATASDIGCYEFLVQYMYGTNKDGQEQWSANSAQSATVCHEAPQAVGEVAVVASDNNDLTATFQATAPALRLGAAGTPGELGPFTLQQVRYEIVGDATEPEQNVTSIQPVNFVKGPSCLTVQATYTFALFGELVTATMASPVCMGPKPILPAAVLMSDKTAFNVSYQLPTEGVESVQIEAALPDSGTSTRTVATVSESYEWMLGTTPSPVDELGCYTFTVKYTYKTSETSEPSAATSQVCFNLPSIAGVGAVAMSYDEPDMNVTWTPLASVQPHTFTSYTVRIYDDPTATADPTTDTPIHTVAVSDIATGFVIASMSPGCYIATVSVTVETFGETAQSAPSPHKCFVGDVPLLNLAADNTTGTSPGFSVSWDEPATSGGERFKNYMFEVYDGPSPFGPVFIEDATSTSYFVPIDDAAKLGCYTFRVNYTETLGSKEYVYPYYVRSCISPPMLDAVMPTTSVENDLITVHWDGPFTSTQFEGNFTSFRVEMLDATGTLTLATGATKGSYTAVNDKLPLLAPNCYKAQVTADFGGFGNTTSQLSAPVCHGKALGQPGVALDTDMTAVIVSWDIASAQISAGGAVTQFSVRPTSHPAGAVATPRTVSNDSATSFQWNMTSTDEFGVFTFEVMYTYASGETSAWSPASQNITFSPPPSVTGLSVTAADNANPGPNSRFNVSFDESALGAFKLASYDVVFGNGTNLPPALSYEYTSNSVAFTGLPPGCYTFRVRTLANDFGVVAVSEPSQEHCFAPTPKIVAATAQNDAPPRFQIDWALPSDTSRIERSRIIPSASSQNFNTVADIEGAVTTSSWNLTMASDIGCYEFKVQYMYGLDGNNNPVWSAESDESATVCYEAPEAVGAVSLMATDNNDLTATFQATAPALRLGAAGTPGELGPFTFLQVRYEIVGDATEPEQNVTSIQPVNFVKGPSCLTVQATYTFALFGELVTATTASPVCMGPKPILPAAVLMSDKTAFNVSYQLPTEGVESVQIEAALPDSGTSVRTAGAVSESYEWVLGTTGSPVNELGCYNFTVKYTYAGSETSQVSDVTSEVCFALPAIAGVGTVSMSYAEPTMTASWTPVTSVLPHAFTQYSLRLYDDSAGTADPSVDTPVYSYAITDIAQGSLDVPIAPGCYVATVAIAVSKFGETAQSAKSAQECFADDVKAPTVVKRTDRPAFNLTWVADANLTNIVATNLKWKQLSPNVNSGTINLGGDVREYVFELAAMANLGCYTFEVEYEWNNGDDVAPGTSSSSQCFLLPSGASAPSMSYTPTQSDSVPDMIVSWTPLVATSADMKPFQFAQYVVNVYQGETDGGALVGSTSAITDITVGTADITGIIGSMTGCFSAKVASQVSTYGTLAESSLSTNALCFQGPNPPTASVSVPNAASPNVLRVALSTGSNFVRPDLQPYFAYFNVTAKYSTTGEALSPAAVLPAAADDTTAHVDVTFDRPGCIETATVTNQFKTSAPTTLGSSNADNCVHAPEFPSVPVVTTTRAGGEDVFVVAWSLLTKSAPTSSIWFSLRHYVDGVQIANSQVVDGADRSVQVPLPMDTPGRHAFEVVASTAIGTFVSSRGVSLSSVTPVTAGGLITVKFVPPMRQDANAGDNVRTLIELYNNTDASDVFESVEVPLSAATNDAMDFVVADALQGNCFFVRLTVLSPFQQVEGDDVVDYNVDEVCLTVPVMDQTPAPKITAAIESLEYIVHWNMPLNSDRVPITKFTLGVRNRESSNDPYQLVHSVDVTDANRGQSQWTWQGGPVVPSEIRCPVVMVTWTTVLGETGQHPIIDTVCFEGPQNFAAPSVAVSDATPPVLTLSWITPTTELGDTQLVDFEVKHQASDGSEEALVQANIDKSITSFNIDLITGAHTWTDGCHRFRIVAVTDVVNQLSYSGDTAELCFRRPKKESSPQLDIPDGRTLVMTWDAPDEDYSSLPLTGVTVELGTSSKDIGVTTSYTTDLSDVVNSLVSGPECDVPFSVLIKNAYGATRSGASTLCLTQLSWPSSAAVVVTRPNGDNHTDSTVNWVPLRSSGADVSDVPLRAFQVLNVTVDNTTQEVIDTTVLLEETNTTATTAYVPLSDNECYQLGVRAVTHVPVSRAIDLSSPILLAPSVQCGRVVDVPPKTEAARVLFHFVGLPSDLPAREDEWKFRDALREDLLKLTPLVEGQVKVLEVNLNFENAGALLLSGNTVDRALVQFERVADVDSATMHPEQVFERITELAQQGAFTPSNSQLLWAIDSGRFADQEPTYVDSVAREPSPPEPPAVVEEGGSFPWYVPVIIVILLALGGFGYWKFRKQKEQRDVSVEMGGFTAENDEDVCSI
ncbi:MAG: hypothetical protein MHM6MM_000823 [Cercozoa sp. M6MM]